VVVGIVVLVVALTSLGGGSSKGNKSATTAATKTGAHAQRTPATKSHSAPPSEASTPAASPAETHVAVLNGTSTAGLAHRLSTSLQQSGYTQSVALNGTPPGSHQTSVVEYASGHRADAQGVASALSVSQVQPMEGSVSGLTSGATVVVVAGLDKATAATGSGEAAGGATGTTP
jgi:hypothetical protein